MNKKVIIAVVVIILFGFGGYMMMSKKTPTVTAPTSDITKSQIPTDSGKKQGSLKDLFTAGVSQTCTYTTKSENSTSSGTVYTAGGKMRGDFSSVVSGKEVKSHMIVMDNLSYIWTDGETKGFKTEFSSEDNKQKTLVTPGASKTAGSVDLETMADYDCKLGMVTASFFELPEGIKFVSLSDMMESARSSQCAACDSLTGESKTNCQLALKCN